MAVNEDTNTVLSICMSEMDTSLFVWGRGWGGAYREILLIYWGFSLHHFISRISDRLQYNNILCQIRPHSKVGCPNMAFSYDKNAPKRQSSVCLVCLLICIDKVFHESWSKFFTPLFMRYKGQPWTYSKSIILYTKITFNTDIIIKINFSAHWPPKMVHMTGFIDHQLLPLLLVVVTLEKLLDLTRMIRATLQPQLSICTCSCA